MPARAGNGRNFALALAPAPAPAVPASAIVGLLLRRDLGFFGRDALETDMPLNDLQVPLATYFDSPASLSTLMGM